jgi:hypothetical protein
MAYICLMNFTSILFALWLILASLASIPLCYGQSLTKVLIDSTDPFRLSINDHSHELAYYALSDSLTTPQALLVLLPGLGEAPYQAFTQTTLAQEAALSGILTIVPSLNNRIYDIFIFRCT